MSRRAVTSTGQTDGETHGCGTGQVTFKPTNLPMAERMSGFMALNIHPGRPRPSEEGLIPEGTFAAQSLPPYE